jgi:hypothetical protein
MDSAMITDIEALIERELPGMPGWCTTVKGKRMALLAYGAELCVELGVFGARSLVAVAVALRDQQQGEAHGIDPYTVDAALEGKNAVANDEWWAKVDLEAIYRGAQETLEKLQLTSHARLIRARSQDVVSGYAPGSIDLLHQDSNHSEEVSCKEVELWTPKIKPGGYWVLDDTDWASTKRAQEMLVDLEFTLIEDHGGWRIYRRPGK